MRSSIVAACALALLGCGRAPEEHAPATTHAVSPDGTVSLTGASRSYVQVEPAEPAPPVVTRSLIARVALDERHTASLGAPVSGRLVAVDVVPGTIVAAGAPLLTIQSTDVAEARARLAQARDTRRLAEESAARAEHLLDRGAGSEAERQQADTALAIAQTEERRAEQALRALGLDVAGRDYVLRAPIAGVVVERNAQVGNAVSADQGPPLVTISDLGSVWVLADVYEQDLGSVRVGDEARVVVPALDDRTYGARVVDVGHVVDAVTRAAPARLELSNADGALRPGMFARVEVESRVLASARVPTSAVLARRDEFFVFVQSGEGLFRVRSVRLGPEHAGHVAIVEGLEPGEIVVTRGAILLDAEASAAF